MMNLLDSACPGGVILGLGVLSQKYLTILPPIHPVSQRWPRSPTWPRSPALRRWVLSLSKDASRATRRPNSGNEIPAQNTEHSHFREVFWQFR